MGHDGQSVVKYQRYSFLFFQQGRGGDTDKERNRLRSTERQEEEEKEIKKRTNRHRMRCITHQKHLVPSWHGPFGHFDRFRRSQPERPHKPMVLSRASVVWEDARHELGVIWVRRLGESVDLRGKEERGREGKERGKGKRMCIGA